MKKSRRPLVVSQHLLAFVSLGLSAFLVSQLTAASQTVTNGDFSANGALFTNAPGYVGSGTPGSNPATITGFTASEGAVGIDVPATGGNYNGLSSFSPQETALSDSGAITYFAFIQDTGSLTGTVTGLTIGDTYQLTFDAGERRDPGHTDPGTGTVSLTNAVDASDILTPASITATGGNYTGSASGDPAGFSAYSLNFVATGTMSAIKLTNNKDDTSFDYANVAVTFVSAPLPEPSTYALLGLGALASFFIGRTAWLKQ